ncbi:paraquat-inducible protein A [Paludibacterium paludis]|uniref:Paraquat-inducible protein n=2 Tax=Paludibacterium paludis TaxID=1225769 RepID=A0A918P1K0_9NEIS|nr:paraquat-inducible protein A [Paludibacterium paludis]GGY13375.1 paraquat-inducible protein [Paludibacterium paludis]
MEPHFTWARQNVLACHDCDLLLNRPARPGRFACPRCGAVLGDSDGHAPETSLALVLAGVIAFIIANAHPVVGLDANGLRSSTTLIGCALTLFDQQMPAIGALVLFTAVLVPALELGAQLYLLAPLCLGLRPPGFARMMRLARVAHPWGMVEVFLLGTLVALVKLAHLARVEPGIGLWCFFALITLLAANASRFNPALLWERYASCRPLT